MIAKLVTHAPTRAAAIEAQASALDAFYIDGIRHNIPFLSALMQHPRWREGKLSTGFIAEEFPKGFAARRAGRRDRAPAGRGRGRDRSRARRTQAADFRPDDRPRRCSASAAARCGSTAMKSRSMSRAKPTASRCASSAPTAAGNPHHLVSPWKPGEPVWQGTIDGHLVAMQVRPIANGFRLAHQGFEVAGLRLHRSEAAAARLMPVKTAADTGKKLLCPMPGLVVSIAVTEGQEVKAGETLAVVEAMKMENVLRAERDGTVKKIHAAAGATLAVDALILEFA